MHVWLTHYSSAADFILTFMFSKRKIKEQPVKSKVDKSLMLLMHS